MQNRHSLKVTDALNLEPSLCLVKLVKLWELLLHLKPDLDSQNVKKSPKH